MNNKEQIYQLETIIRKRLGKKANQIWTNLRNDLFIADLIRNHINRTSTLTYGEPIQKENYTIYPTDFIYQYTCKELDEEGKEIILNWLKANIDKERLKEWLEK